MFFQKPGNLYIVKIPRSICALRLIQVGTVSEQLSSQSVGRIICKTHVPFTRSIIKDPFDDFVVLRGSKVQRFDQHADLRRRHSTYFSYSYNSKDGYTSGSHIMKAGAKMPESQSRIASKLVTA